MDSNRTTKPLQSAPEGEPRESAPGISTGSLKDVSGKEQPNNAGASEKRLAANRMNALKSTGPKTPSGKARSSRNALETRHAF
jgi:hypothetical protein